ncbi:uncharacterized protein LAESUDRAFT_746954 [Laetiporus sulphureus 93-53]|uniref:Uncharacterized protein n=1 Tax=Laetiporus sulphureus 93-53 TaxID=1314785 RepID=A0A165H1W3_9APHY|nr:uncharacterized protein LAESUDRAFT_746954 [Laetiporus sulphureus 93-53]KZT11129.1 hypothetical protein LAESUDRAFT_746954 [Laetiporus sulphureus 93-53]
MCDLNVAEREGGVGAKCTYVFGREEHRVAPARGRVVVVMSSGRMGKDRHRSFLAYARDPRCACGKSPDNISNCQASLRSVEALCFLSKLEWVVALSTAPDQSRLDLCAAGDSSSMHTQSENLENNSREDLVQRSTWTAPSASGFVGPLAITVAGAKVMQATQSRAAWCWYQSQAARASDCSVAETRPHPNQLRWKLSGFLLVKVEPPNASFQTLGSRGGREAAFYRGGCFGSISAITIQTTIGRVAAVTLELDRSRRIVIWATASGPNPPPQGQRD